MNILVTGGAGYIGTHTLVELLNRGHSAVVVDNLVNSHPAGLERVRQITGKAFQFYELDICDEGALSEVFARHEIDCVIHFAGLKAVGESCEKPLSYYRNNLDGMMSLLSSMERHGVKKLVFSSSATVYRPDAPMPVDENSPLGSINPYGWTKFMGEQMLRDMSTAHPDWSIVLLRYFNPIGAHESGLIGEDPSGIPNNLMPFITQTALGRREVLSVFGDDYPTPDGTGVRDYIHVVDLAEGHVAAIGYAAGHAGCEAFNLGTGQGYSVLDIVKAFERVNGIPVPYQIAPRRAGDPPTVYSKVEKAAEALGFRAERTLEMMCRDAWNWQTKNPEGFAKGR